MKKKKRRPSTYILYFAISQIFLPVSCTMMRDDRSDCPDCRNPLHVTVRYDYNTARANMFADHVEQATVYVVDPQRNMIVDSQTATNSSQSKPLQEPSFAFNFEGLPYGNYRLFATGCSQADAAFTTTLPQQAEAISKLQFTVPADADGHVPAQRLDTLWNTLQPVDVTVYENEAALATIGLMRLTNDLNVMLFRRDGSLDNDHERYDVSVVDHHLTLGYDNEPVADRPLVYHPFASWTTETTADDGSAGSGADGSVVGTIVERNAHYDLSLSRLMVHNDASQNPRLIILNRKTGHEVVNIDLCYYLALARNAYEIHQYSEQEYLDREYDYRLDFGLEGEGDQEKWKNVTIRINVLSWALRIQNEEL